jgi:hypothetical protein
MQTTCCVSFVGGPLDGHHQSVSLAPGELAAVVMLPISRSIYRLLDGKPADMTVPITSVAEYHLEFSAPSYRYHFVRAFDAIIPAND